MIVWADDNMVNEIPGMWGSGGDEMDDVAGLDRNGDADLYFTDNADADAFCLGDAAAGQAFDRYGYSPYGQPSILDPDQAGPPASRPPGPRPSSRDRLSFAGYLFDDAAGPCLVRNRAYQGELGRWLQRDPAGFVGTCPTAAHPRPRARSARRAGGSGD